MRFRFAATALAVGVFLARASGARADEPNANAVTDEEARRIVQAVNADEAARTAPAPARAAKEEEAPPLPPRRRGLVLESSLGALVFLGRFRQVAPPAPWLHVQLGYEVLSFLMLFGEAELAFTDTSVAEDASKARAFPMFGFGGGARVTARFSERVAAYAQASIGALAADIATGALALEGFRDAESLGLQLAGRVGLEWYQVDRHVALGIAGGLRDAKGFARSGGTSDSPLMVDASLALRYTF